MVTSLVEVEWTLVFRLVSLFIPNGYMPVRIIDLLRDEFKLIWINW